MEEDTREKTWRNWQIWKINESQIYKPLLKTRERKIKGLDNGWLLKIIMTQGT